nr:MAG TPA: hypothetical protein [Caudoviricetes sp.]
MRRSDYIYNKASRSGLPYCHIWVPILFIMYFLRKGKQDPFKDP